MGIAPLSAFYGGVLACLRVVVACVVRHVRVSALDTPRAKTLHSSYNRFPPRMYYRWLVSLCLRNSLPRLFPFSALIMYSFTSNLL